MTEKTKHPLDERTRGKETRPATIRKLARDGKTLTPTEQHRKNALMRQFMANHEGTRNSEAYRSNYDLIDWTK